MKYIEEFRNGELAKAIVEKIKKTVDPNRHYQFMEFCGGHTHAIYRYGIPDLLPENVELVHGPGCPVCVLPIAKVDQAIALAQLPNVIFCSYGDMLRVPGSHKNSLLKAKANGADVRMVYSVDDAIELAKNNPNKEVIFFGIGFETTTPPTVVAIKQAKAMNLKNFSVFCNHVLTPPALAAILTLQTKSSLNGFIGPAHVSIIIGSEAYKKVCQQYHKPMVIAGFEPLDVLHTLLMLIQQVNENRCDVENQYTRAVTKEGNVISQQLMYDVLELRETFEWRGLGWIPNSALSIKKEYERFDAEKKFEIPMIESEEHQGCECGAILCGLKKPCDCKLFEKVCNPENPVGACMVSAEGACAAYYAYGRHKK